MNLHRLSLTSLFFIIVMILACFHIPLDSADHGNEIFVDNAKGNDDNPGSIDSPKKTIKGAFKSLQDNGTIYITPGTYEDENNTNITIQGRDTPLNVIIEGREDIKPVILSRGIAAFNVCENNTLTLKNLEFNPTEHQNGWAVINNGTLNVNNCFFNGISTSNMHGSAIKSSNLLKIEKSYFMEVGSDTGCVDMLSGSKASIIACWFENNMNRRAILFAPENTELIVNDSTFKFNLNPWIIKANFVNVTNCIFNNNKGSLIKARDLELVSTHFIENQPMADGQDTHIEIGTGSFLNCTFTNNKATEVTGDNLTIINNVIEGNTGVKLLKCDNETIIGTEFINNAYKCIIDLDTPLARLNVNNCSFTGNTVTNAVSYEGDCFANICNSSFIKNNGQAIIQGNLLNLTHSQFKENTISTANTPNSNGGIIKISGLNDLHLAMEGCVVRNNEIAGENSAAISAYDLNGRCGLNVHYNCFINNTDHDISLKTNLVTADLAYNWWGTNIGPEDRIKGNVNTYPHLILTLSAPQSIHLDSIISINVHLYRDASGSYHNDSSRYPYMIPISFGGTGGLFMYNGLLDLKNGSGSMTYRADQGSVKNGSKVGICAVDPCYMVEGIRPLIYINII